MKKTPKLRFKEFSGDWESKKLGTMGAFFKGSTLSKAHLSEDGNPCVLYGELYTKYGEVIKNVISKTNLDDSKLVIGQKNDVLIPSSGETAIDIATASCLQQDNVILGGDLNVFRSNELNGIFASYQLNNSKRHEIAKLAQGASVVHVYNTQLSKLKLSVPSKEEQEKMASFFSLIDDRISLQGDKVEALKDYKKGMMQKIFSRELRFKDDEGRDYPKWEEKKLGDIGSVVTGNTPATKDKDNYGNEYLWASPVDLGSSKVIDTTISKLSAKGFGKIRKVPKGSILVTCIGSTIGKIGMAYEEMSTNQQINTLICNHDINNEFIYYSLEYNFPRYLSYVTSQAVPIINKTQFQEFDINIPVLEEQVKIGKVLSKIEVKIEIEQQKLKSLNEYKKGLLQQMFV